MSIQVPYKTAYKVVHMHVHLDTSFCLIPPTKILLDRYDDKLDLHFQEELWMSDKELTDFVFQDVVPRVSEQDVIHTLYDFHYHKHINQELKLCHQFRFAQETLHSRMRISDFENNTNKVRYSRMINSWYP
jgi:hypothetical protein